MNIQHLCDQILDMTDYRAQLYDYLKSRMYAVAPNLTVLVGELIGARLISHAGEFYRSILISVIQHDDVVYKFMVFSIYRFFVEFI